MNKIFFKISNRYAAAVFVSTSGSKSYLGRAGGQEVTTIAFNFNNQSLNPTWVDNFSVILLLKRIKLNKKRLGLAHFLEEKPKPT